MASSPSSAPPGPATPSVFRCVSRALSGTSPSAGNLHPARTLGVLAFSALLLLGGCEPEPATEILWDSYGVPHVFSDDRVELFEAQGWAQMEAHGDLILRLYGQARGRAAEYWGPEYLESDVWTRIQGIPERGQAWYLTQDAEMYDYLQAFVEGMNAYARAHPEALAEEVRVVLPVEPGDVMAHLLRAIHFTFVSSVRMVPGRLRQNLLAEALGDPVGDAQEGGSLSGPSAGDSDVTTALAFPGPRDAGLMGSNAWAVGPSRSASGNAMLLINPHLPWNDLFLWHEIHLAGPDFNAYGATLVGMPLVTLGFTDHVAWAHTVNTYDGADLYELTLEGDGYLFDGEVRPFDVRLDTLRVSREDGTLEERILTIRRSVHGPVLGQEEGKAYAMRVAGLEQTLLFRQYYEMLRAENLEDFEAAMSMMQMPMFTTMYADAEGHIMHLFNGLVPERDQGDTGYWARVIPGTTSATLWTEYHSFSDLPRVVDPGSGWLQNANDPPWTTTFPRPDAMDPDEYPAYMAPRSMHPRAQRSAKMLMEDNSLTFDELVAYKHSTRVELADRLLDDLLPLAREQGSENVREAAEVLEAWDRTTDADSRGAVLFLEWSMNLYNRARGNPWATAWDPARPMDTPDGLADPGPALDALDAAVDSVMARHGDLSVPFGEVNRVQRDGVDLPGNGGRDPAGIFRAAWYEPTGEGVTRAIVGGDSFVLALEFADPIRARAVLGYGNSSQPDSPHRTDQLELFSRKETRPVWRTRSDVEANLSRSIAWPPEEGG